MENDCKYLFVYGTLLENDNEFGAFLKSNSNHITSGSFNGYLYDLGEYPGAIYDPLTKQQVFGQVLLLDNDPAILKTLDEYEGFGEEDDQPDLFIRRIIPVHTDKKIMDCYVYLYNLPVTGCPQISSGIYNA